MLVKVLTGPQICIPTMQIPGTPLIAFAGVIVQFEEESFEPGWGKFCKKDIFPVRISYNGDKDLPIVGEIIDVEFDDDHLSGVFLIYKR